MQFNEGERPASRDTPAPCEVSSAVGTRRGHSSQAGVWDVGRAFWSHITNDKVGTPGSDVLSFSMGTEDDGEMEGDPQFCR